MVNIEKITVDDYENRITGEDIEDIIRLLDEYSEKLREACDSLIRNPDLKSPRDKKSLADSYPVVIGLLVGLSTIGLDVVRAWGGQTRGGVMLTFYLLILLLLYGSFSIKLNRIRTGGKITESLTRYTVNHLAERLSEMIGLASPVYEHIKIKRIKKIELALKLAEAESTLQYYKETINNLTPKK